MLTLTLDTATPHGRFALTDGATLLVYQPYNVQGQVADAILPVLSQMVAQAGKRLAEVALVGVTDGPGSFTGVRIGVATAKTLAWALGAELAAASTLAAMAADLLASHPERRLAVPALDARRAEVFAAVYQREGLWVKELAAPACLTPDRWWERIGEVVADRDEPVYGGDGLALLVRQGESLRPELTGCGLPAARSWSAAHPATARALGLALADDGLRRTLTVSPFALTPRYLRGTDAEILRELDATPTVPSRQVDIHSGGDLPGAGR